MKLKYDFEYTEIGNRIIAVPVGENAAEYSGIIDMTSDSKEIFELIKESKDANEVLQRLILNHPDETRKELTELLCDFLNVLIDQGILDVNDRL